MFKVGFKVRILSSRDVLTVKAVEKTTLALGLGDTDGALIHIPKDECALANGSFLTTTRWPMGTDLDRFDQFMVCDGYGKWEVRTASREPSMFGGPLSPDDMRVFGKETSTGRTPDINAKYWCHTPAYFKRKDLPVDCKGCVHYLKPYVLPLLPIRRGMAKCTMFYRRNGKPPRPHYVRGVRCCDIRIRKDK